FWFSHVAHVYFISLLPYLTHALLSLLSFLHDALPISPPRIHGVPARTPAFRGGTTSTRWPRSSKGQHAPRNRRETPSGPPGARRDRKSTRLNSSHGSISYAVFCLKTKKKNNK